MIETTLRVGLGNFLELVPFIDGYTPYDLSHTFSSGLLSGLVNESTRTRLLVQEEFGCIGDSVKDIASSRE